MCFNVTHVIGSDSGQVLTSCLFHVGFWNRNEWPIPMYLI